MATQQSPCWSSSILLIPNYYFLMMTLGSLWGWAQLVRLCEFQCWCFIHDPRSSLSLFNSRSRLLWVSPVKRGHLSIRATAIADLPVDTSRRGGVRRVNKSCVTQSNPAYIPLLGIYTKWPKNCWWTRRQQPGGWIKTTPPTSTMEINRLPAAPPIRPSFTFVTSPDFGFKEWV